MKEKVFLHADCQGEAIKKFLEQNPEMASRYDIHYHYYWVPIPDGLDLTQFQVCLYQVFPSFDEIAFEKRFSPDCKFFAFPGLREKFLWPTCVIGDPRNFPETEYPFGRWDYGDTVIRSLLRENVPLQEIPKRYLDSSLGCPESLYTYANLCLDRSRKIDLRCDVQTAGILEWNFKSCRLFATFNHPHLSLLRFISNAILSELVGTPPAAYFYDESTGMLGVEEWPIHPQIARHFGLSWWSPEMKYRWRSKQFTIEEWALAYASFESVHFNT